MSVFSVSVLAGFLGAGLVVNLATWIFAIHRSGHLDPDLIDRRLDELRPPRN